MSGMRWRPFRELLFARIKEAMREPEVIFWVFIFPFLLAVGLGIAFRNKPIDRIRVGIEERDGAGAAAAALNASGRFSAAVCAPPDCRARLRLGKVAVLVVPSTAFEYRFDPTRPDSVLARALVDDALQRAAGRADAVPVTDTVQTEPGARYIDFLIPGILGMNLMSGGMWGVGFVVVDMRIKKLLKRLVSTPMHRSEFLGAMIASRILFTLGEVALLLLMGYLLFGVVVRGSLLAISLIALLGALAFASLGLLVASRAQKIETVSGLMNLVMMPMFVFSGIFFSADRFPDAFQPVIRALPLTALNDALRAVIIEGADLSTQAARLAILAAYTAVAFTLALRWFRWT